MTAADNTTHADAHTDDPSVPRLDFDAHADGFSRALSHLDHAATKELDAAGIDARLRELMRLRASQLNGCAYCIDMHTKDARAIGETEQRLYALPAWAETPYFTTRERAALAFTESVTLVAGEHVPPRLRGGGGRVQPGRGGRAGQLDRGHQRLERDQRRHPGLGARDVSALSRVFVRDGDLGL